LPLVWSARKSVAVAGGQRPFPPVTDRSIGRSVFRMRRFRTVIAVVVVALLVASAAVAIAAAATFGDGSDARHASVPTTRATSPKARANLHAARLDAASRLTTLNLPGGATRASAEPAHDHGYLNPLPRLQSELASVTAHAWWTVPGDPQSVLTAIEADRPAGARQDGTGSGGNFKTGTSELDVDYAWPSVVGVLGDRLLRVTVTGIGGGLTGVLAESQSEWIVPRPAGERIPTSTRVVEINSAVPGAADGGDVTITRPAQVGSIVALLNALPLLQPGVTACPLLSDPKTITMTFRARAAAPALAVLRFDDFRLWKAASSGVCAPVQLSIGGRRRAALDGGGFVTRIERIIALSIT
jgi:hypothetical protein